MTTFAELTTLTIEQTRRPELADVTSAAIRTATLRAHHVDFFPRDLRAGGLVYIPSSTAFYDFATIGDTFSRLRSIKHVQCVDAVTGVVSEQLEFREQDDLYDNYGFLREHIYTLLGDTLRVYPTAHTGALTVYYYENPNTAGAGYASWIADAYPDELAAWAAAIVFARTGFAEMAKQFMDLHVTPFKEMLIQSHLLGNVT